MNILTSTTSVLAFDVGDRRIGVARASLQARIASPILTFDRRDHADIFASLIDLISKEAAEVVVLGLPRGMEGQETAQTATTRAFSEQLKTRLAAASREVEIFLQDEAATSIVAEEALQASGKNYTKGDIDSHAAAIILDDWLHGQEAIV